jgi:hypothetical protein
MRKSPLSSRCESKTAQPTPSPSAASSSPSKMKSGLGAGTGMAMGIGRGAALRLRRTTWADWVKARSVEVSSQPPPLLSALRPIGTRWPSNTVVATGVQAVLSRR